MVNRASEYWMTPGLEHCYEFSEDDLCAVWHVGLLVYAEGDVATSKSPLNIAHMALVGELDYNKLFGFYKIVVLDKIKSITYFWGDNSGSKRFYYCKNQGVFADTLPACVQKLTTKVSPCFEAIVQYLTIDRTLDEKTIVDGVLITSRENVYVAKNGKIYEISKKLCPYSALNPNFCLDKLMRILTAKIKTEKLSAVITGGTDSRCILAHLTNLKLSPKLLITGRAESADVIIAKKIANHLNLSIDVYNPNEKEKDWLKRAFAFSNGIYDVVLSYRHLKKAELNSNHSAAYEFGGVGGEFYKNAYCRPFRYAQPFKKLTAEDIIGHTIGGTLSNRIWFGENVSKAQQQVYRDICDRLSKKMEDGFLRNYNIFANEMLANCFYAITDNLSPYCTKIDPLMDRNLIASVCYKEPISLSMARWQRHEILLHCPELSEIETDQGLSCSLRPNRLLIETLSKLCAYSKLAMKKMKRVISRKDKNETTVWDQDYIEARTMPEYFESVNVCKELGIISENSNPYSLPINKTGFILMIGMFFKPYI